MITNRSTPKERFYVYVASMVDGELYIGHLRRESKPLDGLTFEVTNPRVRAKLPLKLLRCWEVESVATARSIGARLQNASHELVRSAIRDSAADLHNVMRRALGEKPMIHCAQCGALRPRFWTREICESCFRKEPSAKCAKCHQLRHLVSAETGLCPKCAEIKSRPIQKCTRCKKLKRIFDGSKSMCRECLKYLRLCARRTKPEKVLCTDCGKVRSAGRRTRDICTGCARKERAIAGICAKCGKLKPFRIKSRALCARCSLDLSAPGMIRRFIRNFRSPFPGSQEAFEVLARAVAPDNMNIKQAMRMIHFGKYLQSHELAYPLTWNAIDQVLATISTLPPVPDSAQNVRSCLLSVGHLLANTGKIESRKEYVLHRRLSRLIARAQDDLKPVLQSFVHWSFQRKTTCKYILRQVSTICEFWNWCTEQRIALSSINEYCIDRYFDTKRFELHCDRCGATTSIDSEATRGSVRCHCGSQRPPVRVPKLSPETIIGVRSCLVVFLDWACMNGLTLVNPARIQLGNPQKRIQHCSFDALPKLYRFIMDPKSDPAQAFALYLTITHLFTSWELQQVKLPRSDDSSAELDLARVYGLTAPKRSPSVGMRSDGRELACFSFPESARSWLIGLLSRFQAQRSRILNGRTNDYLFVAPGRIHNNVPVSTAFTWRLVRHASRRALGYEVPQSLLRKTASLVVAAKAGPAILKYLGYGEKQAIAYLERPKELVASSRVPTFLVLDGKINAKVSQEDHRALQAPQAGSEVASNLPTITSSAS